ncbi:MAG: hypothetical protein JST00_29570 [Deltaproteobacteria bacterium]|nr:hypothetical protein [Deltaproteobacteria bacterium]
MDPRLSLAFRAYRMQVLRAVGMRALVIAALLGGALYVRHWGMWTFFGITAFLQSVAAIAVLLASRSSRHVYAELEADPRQLVWLHSMAEPRTKLHRVELHTRAGDTTLLFVPPPIAKGAIEAAREQPQTPTVTTDAAAHAAVEPRHRLAGKLTKLERSARAARAPKLTAAAEDTAAAAAAWRERLVGAALHPYRAERDAATPEGSVAIGAGPLDARLVDVEARVDKLLHLYSAAALGEDHRAKMSSIAREKALPEEVFAREHFTDDIATLVAELRALADRTPG